MRVLQVRGILKELLIDEGVGPAGRLAVEVTFPFGCVTN